MGRLFAIGDIHGYARTLQALLDKIKPEPDDEIIFLGDYIDRGPESPKVVDIILDLDCDKKRLMGNHEDMLINSRWRGPDISSEWVGTWTFNGGYQTIEAYKNYKPHMEDGHSDDHLIPDRHKEFFESLAQWYMVGDVIFVHAGIKYDNKVIMTDDRFEGMKRQLMASEATGALLWVKQQFLSDNRDFNGYMFVVGHTPQKNGTPLKMHNKMVIDTGMVYENGNLTAIEFLNPDDPTIRDEAAYRLHVQRRLEG